MRSGFLVRPISILAAVTFLSIASPAVVPMHAQPSHATLIGTVYDPLGARILWSRNSRPTGTLPPSSRFVVLNQQWGGSTTSLMCE